MGLVGLGLGSALGYRDPGLPSLLEALRGSWGKRSIPKRREEERRIPQRERREAPSMSLLMLAVSPKLASSRTA